MTLGGPGLLGLTRYAHRDVDLPRVSGKLEELQPSIDHKEQTNGHMRTFIDMDILMMMMMIFHFAVS